MRAGGRGPAARGGGVPRAAGRSVLLPGAAAVPVSDAPRARPPPDGLLRALPVSAAAAAPVQLHGPERARHAGQPSRTASGSAAADGRTGRPAPEGWYYQNWRRGRGGRWLDELVCPAGCCWVCGAFKSYKHCRGNYPPPSNLTSPLFHVRFHLPPPHISNFHPQLNRSPSTLFLLTCSTSSAIRFYKQHEFNCF
jgi:hypothetical protein